MDKAAVDYSLYLVTDSTPGILGSRNLAEVVDAAIRGGVTIVQYRDKTLPRDSQIRVARSLHAVTRRHGVPLLINDRVDVAAEVGCEGVHVGQDDMNILEARQILGPDKIIGVSAATVQEAITAAENGADYIGIGAIFATPT
jgi:thiamine-phosphate diphosphorylase / hydroxyethylthiazole kinase